MDTNEKNKMMLELYGAIQNELQRQGIAIPYYLEARKRYEDKKEKEITLLRLENEARQHNKKMTMLKGKTQKAVMKDIADNFNQEGTLSGSVPKADYQIVFGVMAHGDHVPSVEPRTVYGMHNSKDMVYAFTSAGNKSRFYELKEINRTRLAKTNTEGEPRKVPAANLTEMSSLSNAFTVDGSKIHGIIEALYKKCGGETPVTSYVSLVQDTPGSQIYLKISWRIKK